VVCLSHNQASQNVLGCVRLPSLLGFAAGGLWQQNPDTTKAQLRNFLANSGAAWKFVVGHHPVASFGSHCKFKMSGDCDSMSWLESELQVRLMPHRVHPAKLWNDVRLTAQAQLCLLESPSATAAAAAPAAAGAHWCAMFRVAELCCKTRAWSTTTSPTTSSSSTTRSNTGLARVGVLPLLGLVSVCAMTGSCCVIPQEAFSRLCC